MKTKLFILSLTALVFSTMCYAQEHDLLGKQIDTTQTELVVQVDTKDSTFWMVSPNPPYIIDSNIVIEPQIAICGGIYPFTPDTMIVKDEANLVEFYWSKDKFNAPYYYLLVATDSSFHNIIYDEHFLKENIRILEKVMLNKPQIAICYDSATYKERFNSRYYWKVGVDTKGWGLYYNEPNGQDITWSNISEFELKDCYEPNYSKCLAFPNPAVDEIRVDTKFGDLIELLDSNGSVLVTTYGSEVSTTMINISQLKSGNYFLKITSGGDVKTSRIIKQ